MSTQAKPNPGTVAIDELPLAQLERMATAGVEVQDCRRVLTKTGDNIVGELLKDHDTFFEWDHYPPGDVFDDETNAQFYYHAHEEDERMPGEHGHFHTFVREEGLPARVLPAPVPDFDPKPEDGILTHLIGISMSPAGDPIRLFTTNRWVTGETWYTADDVIATLGHFVIDLAQPSWPVNRWITAMLRLFRPQIVELFRARDERVAAWQLQHADANVFEDRDLNVTSDMTISVRDQVAAIDKAVRSWRKS
jgi:hypothetical protein